MYNKVDKQAYIVNGGKMKSNKITALLSRLSKEDELGVIQKVFRHKRYIEVGTLI